MTEPDIGTISGDGWASGLTWNKIGSAADGGSTVRVSVYRSVAPGSPTSGTVSITAGGTPDLSCAYVLQTTSTLLSAVPVQIIEGGGSGASPSVTLGSSPNGSNTQVAVFFADTTSGTAGSGYTEIADEAFSSAVVLYAESDTTAPSDGVADATLTSANVWAGVSWEMDETAGGGGLSIPVAMRTYRNRRA